MQPADFNELPKELQEKIRLSREAFDIAMHVRGLLNERFQIDDLNVAATMQKRLTVSGKVESKAEQTAVADFLRVEMPDWACTVDLIIP